MKFIYGAGRYGTMLQQYMNETQGGADYFVQTSEPECNKEINGIPVISLAQMAKMQTNKLIFIAMNNIKVIREVEKNIYDCCGTDSTIRVYSYKDFINENLLIRRMANATGTKQCIVCGNNVDQFCPGGIDQEVFQRHHIIGGGYRETYKCPYCQTVDRTRWLYYVLKTYTNIFQLSGRVLHFAPEKAIEHYIKQNINVDYYSGDIARGKAMHVIDITDIPYRDNMFDYVISNHILEHIVDEERAISEIKRVLKKEGKWIFSFPVCMDIKTYEDERILSPEQRLESYGQKDHVRLYGNDFVERFEKYGFKLNVYSPQNELGDALIQKY